MNPSNKRLLFWLGVIAVITVSVLVVISGTKTNPQDQANKTTTLSEPISEIDNTKGNKDAKIQIVEYSDFQCPACASYFPILRDVMKEFGNYVYFSYRNFPIRSKHLNADISAYAAEAAARQGKFWEMHDLLFENQTFWSGESGEAAQVLFTQYANQLGLDTQKFMADMADKNIQRKVDDDLESGLNSGVQGTPSVFVDGKKLEFNLSLDEFRVLIRQKLENQTK
ncbi:thioredoxin domain-containing protein [Candidatus Peregrinibacteria bacterium]|nr:thioredoxin domain-containing protein [Candidatus Peregrinibacteria bacterium]